MLRSIIDFGAVPDGRTNCAAAIQAAVDAAAGDGGGTVLIPAGRWLSGSVLLKSHVTLQLESGACLVSSLDESEIFPFPASPEEGPVDGWNGGFFLGGRDAEDVRITGGGVIDGQGDRVFTDADVDSGFHECPYRCAPFRPRMVLFENIRGLEIGGVTLRNAAFWTLHMAGCRDVRIHDIRILNDDRGANNDGIDPDCCRNVVISNCLVETGDDAIVLKATRPVAAKYGNCENITISGCVLHSRDSALKIGTETWGDIRNVIFSDCVVDRCSRAAGIWVRDGGRVEKVQIHHLTGSTRRYAEHIRDGKITGWWGKGEALFLSAVRRPGEDRAPGAIRQVRADHLQLDTELGYFLAADGEGVIEDVSVTESEIRLRKQSGHIPEYYDEQPSRYGVYRHELSWLYARGVKQLTVEGKVAIDPEMKKYISGEAETVNCEGVRIRV